ncbi:MAG: hypothetical protein WBE28_04825 [bacterium]
MHKKVAQQVLLKVFSVLIVLGGLVRLVANRQTFHSFMIEELWVSHPYYIYIYRILGAFVVFTGITMFVISLDPVTYRRILGVWGYCFLFISIVMLIAGHSLHMSFIYYAFDFIFCFFIAVVCFSLAKHRA